METDRELEELIDSLPLRLKTPKLIPVINPKAYVVINRPEINFWIFRTKPENEWVMSVGCPFTHPVWAALVHPMDAGVRLGKHYVVWTDEEHRNDLNDFIAFHYRDFNYELRIRLLEQTKDW